MIQIKRFHTDDSPQKSYSSYILLKAKSTRASEQAIAYFYENNKHTRAAECEENGKNAFSNHDSSQSNDRQAVGKFYSLTVITALIFLLLHVESRRNGARISHA